ncbi:MAG: hypothetical protein IJM76_02320 [Lachnospiraceae bacterium]|nr:hypothetical protein [Lachnospiraceae bacterium]
MKKRMAIFAFIVIIQTIMVLFRQDSKAVENNYFFINDLYTAEVELLGDYYRLPCSLQSFVEAGWKMYRFDPKGNLTGAISVTLNDIILFPGQHLQVILHLSSLGKGKGFGKVYLDCANIESNTIQATRATVLSFNYVGIENGPHKLELIRKQPLFIFSKYGITPGTPSNVKRKLFGNEVLRREDGSIVLLTDEFWNYSFLSPGYQSRLYISVEKDLQPMIVANDEFYLYFDEFVGCANMITE